MEGIWNSSLTEGQLTLFEKARDNADYFIASCILISSIQNVVKTWNENLQSVDVLDWENDREERELLKSIMQTQRELSYSLIEAANKFEKILGISA